MTGRLRLLTCIALLVWGAVSIRLVYVQWFRHQPFAEHALAQCALDEVIPARLGDIVDRRGRLLATTSTSNSLYLDPSRITHPDEVAARLADALALDATVLSDRITQSAHRKFLWVKRRLSEVEVRRVIDLDLPRHPWGFREEFLRVYPQGTLSAHVLGWRDIDGLPQSGLERTLDADLQGTPGRRTYVRDARGYVIEVLEEVAQAPRHGGQVTLTIDLAVQRVAEDRLDSLIAQWRPSAASVVAMDPRTGEILAMASRPTFHPARPGDAPPDAWTNHAVASAYEPGSTIKPCVAAWAVDRGIVSRDDTFACRGILRMGRRELHDHRSYGMLDVSGVIARSSNIGMAQIGLRLGNERLHTVMTDFGFGRKTGVEIPGEAAGVLRPLSAWNDFSTGSIPMGQELAATPLQVIAAHAVLANGGRWITPHLVLRRAGNGPSSSVLSRTVLSRSTAAWMTSGPMVDVVRVGTARQSAVPGLSVFAKTGTAQKFDPATGAYSHDRHVCSCICGAPADQPRLLILVTVDEPKSDSERSGGTVAAAAAADILRQSLDLLPGDGPTSSSRDRWATDSSGSWQRIAEPLTR